MITKTIGGDRLGAGKKMKQSYHNYERSNHDLSYVWRSTMAPGVLIPFMSELMNPGDTFDIELNTEVMTHPTVGPLFGSYKLQLDIFQIPIRLYQAQLHNNKLGIGMDMANIKLPIMNISTNVLDINSDEPLDVQQINPSSLLSYLDIKGMGYKADASSPTRTEGVFTGLKYLMYYDIYKNYYANKQEEIGAFINYTTVLEANITNTQIVNSMTNSTIPLPATIPGNATIISINGTHLEATNILVRYKMTSTDPDSAIITTALSNILGQIDTTTDTDGNGASNISGFVQAWVVGRQIIEVVVKSPFMTQPIPQISTFPLKNLDDMREDILADIKNTNAFTITRARQTPYGDNLKTIIEGGLPSTNTDQHIRSYMPMQGLALKTYQSDLFNNWISTEWIDGENGISAITSIDVSKGLLSLDTLNLSKKVYNMLNRISISGGTYYDWIEAVYTEQGFHGVETPVYVGGLSKEVIFQEVVSNSASEGEPLGTLAGRGVQSNKHKGGKMTVRAKVEQCYVMGIISLTPRIDYSQGNKWDNNLKTMNDFHKPALDGIGYQDLITDQMAFWSTGRYENGETLYKSAGKQPAWINYMTNVNKTYGLFADPRNEMFMTLNRRYETEVLGA